MTSKNLFVLRYRVKTQVGIQEALIEAYSSETAVDVGKSYCKRIHGDYLGVRPAVVATEDEELLGLTAEPKAEVKPKAKPKEPEKSPEFNETLKADPPKKK